MILLDANVVLAAYRDDHELHRLARPWLDDLCRTAQPFGVPLGVWATVLRLATNGRVFRLPSPISDVLAFARAVAGQPNHQRLEPGPRHLDLLEALCTEGRVVSDLVNDAALAAIAVEHGATVASFDRDFARFPKLRWIVPGADATS